MSLWQDALKLRVRRLPHFVGGVFFALSLHSKAFFSSDVEVFTDEERLRGFVEQQNKNSRHDKKRQAGAAIVSQRRKEWSQALDQSVADYKAWKARQKKALDESSPEYSADLERRKNVLKKMQDLEKEYVQERNEKRSQKKQNVHLTEEHELGLDQKQEPADFRKRALYFSDKQKTSKKTPTGGGSSGSGDFATPPPEFNPPATQPPAPEFYEPEIPPPPPPPPPEFDEAIPPPIFDDVPPEF